VHPDAVPAGDVHHVGDGVDRAGARRAGDRHHGHGQQTCPPVLAQGRVERRDVQPVPPVHGQLPHAAPPQPEHGRGPVDRAVCLGGHVHPAAWARGQPVAADVHARLLVGPLPGRTQRHEVRRRAAAGEHPCQDAGSAQSSASQRSATVSSVLKPCRKYRCPPVAAVATAAATADVVPAVVM
jgi:hypothetical protein